jgi:hypothetical protein
MLDVACALPTHVAVHSELPARRVSAERATCGLRCVYMHGR